MKFIKYLLVLPLIASLGHSVLAASNFSLLNKSNKSIVVKIEYWNPQFETMSRIAYDMQPGDKEGYKRIESKIDISQPTTLTIYNRLSAQNYFRGIFSPGKAIHLVFSEVDKDGKQTTSVDPMSMDNVTSDDIESAKMAADKESMDQK